MSESHTIFYTRMRTRLVGDDGLVKFKVLMLSVVFISMIIHEYKDIGLEIFSSGLTYLFTFLTALSIAFLLYKFHKSKIAVELTREIIHLNSNATSIKISWFAIKEISMICNKLTFIYTDRDKDIEYTYNLRQIRKNEVKIFLKEIHMHFPIKVLG